jgi:molybdopterin-guanine dinucleotide biosynthesis protein A
LEQVGGERILDRVAQALTAATETSPLLIANAAEAAKWRPDLRVIRDAIRDCGSLGGIYTALSEPLCAVYKPICLDAIREQLVDEDFRASGFLDSVNLGTLSREEVERYGDPDTLLFNINTPTDLTKAQELWRSLHEH